MLSIHRCRFVDYTPHAITALKFSHNHNAPAGTQPRLAVGRANGDIEIWNPRWSWIHETTLKGGKGRTVEGLAWITSTDKHTGLRLFSIGGSTSITEWDLKTGLPLTSYDCHAGVIWSLAASEDGSKLAVGCDNGTVVIVDVSGGPGSMVHDRMLQRTKARIMSLAWKDSRHIVGGCSDARIRVWSLSQGDNGRVVSTMRVDKAKTEDTIVWAVVVIRGQIVSGDSTGSVKMWDSSEFTLLQSFQVHEADVLALAADAQGQTLFSAGVDRRIISYQVSDPKYRRWVNVSSRLLHSHDIRALAAWEGAGTGSTKHRPNFLVSGGVEATVVVNSVHDFSDGLFRKIPITRQKPCVAVAPGGRLVALWADQTVKLWGIVQEEARTVVGAKRLVCRLRLNNEQHITHASLTPDGRYLAVATMAEIKLFETRTGPEPGSTIKIEKMTMADTVSGLGATSVQLFYRDGSAFLVAVSPENELIMYNLTSQDTKLLEPEDVASSTSKVPYYDNYSLVRVSDDGTTVAAAKQNGQVFVFDTRSLKGYQLIKASGPPTALHFDVDNTLTVATAEIKVLQFSLASRALTDWSRRNSALLPSEFISLVDKCCGIFSEPSEEKNISRLWLWGATWLCFLDLGQNLGASRVPKRKMDRLGVAVSDPNEAQVSSIIDEVQNSTEDEAKSSTVPFWITHKYRPLLLADSFGPGEMVVVERPAFDMAQVPAFWSNRKIQL